MAYQTSLLEDLLRFDVPVIEIDGWRTRGKSTITPRLGVNHHTAGARTGVVPSLGVCINGRPDVPGPLCNVLLGRDGIARLIAAGVSNNAGRGSWRGITGNSNTLGLEIEHVGTLAEPVSLHILDVAARIQAAFARNRYDASFVIQHFEWTVRKIDFVEEAVPTIYTPDGFRATVDQYLKWDGPTPPSPPGGEMPEKEILEAIETAKPFAVRLSADGAGGTAGQVWVVSPLGRYHIKRDSLNALYYTRAIRLDPNGQPGLIDPKFLADVPIVSAP